MQLTEDTLVQAVTDFRDRDGNLLHATKVKCGTRASLVAKRILHSFREEEPFPSMVSSMAVEVDPRMMPDDWQLA